MATFASKPRLASENGSNGAMTSSRVTGRKTRSTSYVCLTCSSTRDSSDSVAPPSAPAPQPLPEVPAPDALEASEGGGSDENGNGAVDAELKRAESEIGQVDNCNNTGIDGEMADEAGET